MAQADANRQNIKPRVRERITTLEAALDALTFSATPTQAEVEALRDAVADGLKAVFGAVES